MKIYIGSAIQNLDEATYRRLMDELNHLKEELTKRGHEILNFKSVSHRDSTPREIWEWDHAQCMTCDAMIAIALHPSIGLGMEVAFCLTRLDGNGRPNPAFVFATAPKGTNVSKLLLGCDKPTFKFQYYQLLGDIVDLFESSVPKST